MAWIRGQELLITYSKTPQNTEVIRAGDQALIDVVLSSETCGPTLTTDDTSCFYEEIRKLQFMILEANGHPIPEHSSGWPTITTDQELLEKVHNFIKYLKAEKHFNTQLNGSQVLLHDRRAPGNLTLKISKGSDLKPIETRMIQIIRRNKINKKLQKIKDGESFVAWTDDEKIKITYSRKAKSIQVFRNGNPEAIAKVIYHRDCGMTITTNDEKSISDVVKRVEKLRDIGLDD